MKGKKLEAISLEVLPGEGGYFRQTYRSKIELDARTFRIDGRGKRAAATAIYYLVTEEEFSALHRLKADEIYHFYAGDPVELVQLSECASLRRTVMGSDVLNGQSPQVIVPAGVWQGLRLIAGGTWALLGTTMSPGYDNRDFELGQRQTLTEQYPLHSSTILGLTRESAGS